MHSPESDRTLWRYMKLSTLLLLLEGKAYFPSVAQLRKGDPLEAALGDDFDKLLWKNLENGGMAREMYEFFEQKHKDWPEEFPESGWGSIHSSVLGSLFASEVAQRRVAWCWFRSDLESASMWSIYGHQGIAVKTTETLLRKALPTDIQVRIEEISYLDRRRLDQSYLEEIRNPDCLLMPYFAKAMEYETEREVRVVAFCPEGANGRMITNINPEVLIQEVVISPLLPLAESEAIEHFVAERLKTTPGISRRSNLHGETFIDWKASMHEDYYGSSDGRLDVANVPSAMQAL